MKNKNPPPGLPDKDTLREFILSAPTPPDKREIARAFKLQGQDKIAVKRFLRELADEGAIEKGEDKSYKTPNTLPESMLVELTGLDIDGEMRAKPLKWRGEGAPPVIYIGGRKHVHNGLKAGDQVLVRLKKISPHEYDGRILKHLDDPASRVIGIFKPYKGGGYVYPTDKKNREDYFVPPEFAEGLVDGELVVAEPIPSGKRIPREKNPVRIVERLGQKDDPRLISLIAIHSHGIPTEFPKDALKEAQAAKEPDLSGGRIDLRSVPLVTIDGADARDFDDAVYAEPDTDTKNPGGWRLIVAIADVSWYARPHSALDVSALERGNSTYFADRVVPMLPEELSNNLCSLMPKVNRACLACHMRIDQDGSLIDYRFERALMKSAARLTYEEVEKAHQGQCDEKTSPLLETVIQPLYKAYSILKRAREKRGALEIDLPERKALIDEKGRVKAIVPRTRLASHQLIEELMVLANVAAASALEDKDAPCLYRVHDRPSFDRLEATREFLKEMGYSLPKSDDLQPKNINHILKLSAERPDKELIHTLLLRTQSQAVYSPDNLGHFGLALEKYAHFTSPIRRYADLIVHRSLVQAYHLGEGGLDDRQKTELVEIAQHISDTERRSMVAERDVMDRFTAQYLSAHRGAEFAGKISGVTHFGLFVTLAETGADGIVPIRSLPRDFYIHDEKRHRLVGREYGRTFTLAQPVVVRLLEADPMRGSMVFELLTGDVGEEQRSGGFSKRKDPRHEKRRDDRKRGGGKSKRGRDKGKDKGRRR